MVILRTRARRRSRISGFLFSLPLIAALGLLVLYPGGYAFVTSMQDADAYTLVWEWNWFANYLEIFGDEQFFTSLFFTVGFTVAATALEFLLGIVLAFVFNSKFPGKQLAFTLLLVPLMIAPALTGVMLRLFLNPNIGLGASVMEEWGIPLSLFNPDTVFILLVLLDALSWVSFPFLLIYSALQSVPGELLEAASIDGAGYLRSAWSIVVPVIAPVLYIALFLRSLEAFRTFDLIQVLTGGGPGTTTSTVSIYIYKAFSNGEYGVSTAASVIVMLILICFVPVVTKRII